jgi:hypothetical protein
MIVNFGEPAAAVPAPLPPPAALCEALLLQPLTASAVTATSETAVAIIRLVM